MAGVASSTVLVNAKSAFCTSTVAVSVLLPGTWSNTGEVAVALLVTGVVTVTVARRVSVSIAPFARLPTVQSPVPKLYEPAEAIADWNARPAGNRSATATPVAASGPLLVTVTVNVTLVPIDGLALSTTLVTARFATGASTDALSELSAALGSCAEVVAVAVFVIRALLATWAWTVNVADAAFASVPIVHTPAA